MIHGLSGWFYFVYRLRSTSILFLSTSLPWPARKPIKRQENLHIYYLFILKRLYLLTLPIESLNNSCKKFFWMRQIHNITYSGVPYFTILDTAVGIYFTLSALTHNFCPGVWNSTYHIIFHSSKFFFYHKKK